MTFRSANDFETALKCLVPGLKRVDDVRAVAGGCISEANRVAIRRDDGRRDVLFVKRNDASFLDNFRCERDGLVRLREPSVIAVPVPLAVGETNGSSWLITGWVEPGRPDDGFFARFGRELAELHRVTSGDRIGLERDNYLGAAEQSNGASESWPRFVADRRIGFQLDWAQRQGLASGGLAAACGQIIDRMEELLGGREDKTSLLHGDLWSGNYLCGDEGQPVIIDPAVYYGCREAEFGMLRLFGSCPGEFYEAYQQAFPMPSGWQRRVSVYVLYHLLNHLNLFGSGYLTQCQTLAAEILRP